MNELRTWIIEVTVKRLIPATLVGIFAFAIMFALISFILGSTNFLAWDIPPRIVIAVVATCSAVFTGVTTK